MSVHWAEAFERRTVDSLLEQLQEDLRERWERDADPFHLAMSVLADQLGKKLGEEREAMKRKLPVAVYPCPHFPEFGS